MSRLFWLFCLVPITVSAQTTLTLDETVVTGTEGVEGILAYQISGESRSGTPHGWKNFELENMRQLRVLDRQFPGSRADSDQQHRQWDQLFARVK